MSVADLPGPMLCSLQPGVAFTRANDDTRWLDGQSSDHWLNFAPVLLTKEHQDLKFSVHPAHYRSTHLWLKRLETVS